MIRTWTRRWRIGLGPAACVPVLAVLAAPLVGQAPSSAPPRHYAIENARIVTVSGPVIESGTIVIRDGLIVAVGTNVAFLPKRG